MAKLTAAKRRNLPKKDFALAGGRYPIPDASHGRNALARVAQHGTEAEKKAVRKKVHAKFPGIAVGGKKASKRHHKKHSIRKA